MIFTQISILISALLVYEVLYFFSHSEVRKSKFMSQTKPQNDHEQIPYLEAQLFYN